jgi:hypothetical protein
MLHRRRLTLVVAMSGVLLLSSCNLVGRMSVPLGGSPLAPPPSTAPSGSPAVSADGGVTSWVSSASDLVAGDTNGVADVFVRTSSTGVVRRASLTSAGGQSSGAASAPALSGTGRYVAFVSSASDLVAGDTNGVADVFVRDLVGGTTARVSLTSAGGQSAGAASDPAISSDGRYVAFVSSASDLVAGDTNGVADVFVRDVVGGTTTRVSVTAAGGQVNGASATPSISPSGEWVAFASTATNVVSGDSNGVSDVFVARRTGGTVRRASAPDAITKPFQQSNGASTKPQVTDSVSGFTGGGDPVVAYESQATNLAGTDGNGAGSDVFVTTYVLGGVAAFTGRMSPGALGGREAGIGVVEGGPGFVVTYVRSGSPAGGDIVSVERDSPISTAGVAPVVVSMNLDNLPANGPSDEPALSRDGRFVAFSSTAGDLAGGTSGSSVGDVFLTRARSTGISSIEPARVGLQETRDLTVRGRGFEPGSTVWFDKDVVVNSVTFVSSSELLINVTAETATPGDGFRDVIVVTSGAGGSSSGESWVTCEECVEIAAVVEQPGDVDIEITGGNITFGATSFDLPGCVLGTCLALPATVSPDGELSFGLDSLELDPIPIELELIAGVPVTIELVPAFVAPQGAVVPANGAVNLGFGLAVKLRNPLLPSSCALGPVQTAVSAGPGGDPTGVAYDQLTGEATLVGGFTEQLAITGCGFFTGTLNSLLGLPLPIGENSVTFEVRFDPTLTGTVVP